jgi:hypothetical protein
VRIYCGDTRSRRLLAEFRARGWGAVAIRGRLHKRRLSPWFYDNGAFEDWRAKRGFDAEAYSRDLDTIAREHADDPPDFLVAPDVVGAGPASLALSTEWLPTLRPYGWPVYLAVQDGIEESPDLALALAAFDGVFLGGTLPWKLRSAPHWAEACRRLGKPFHFARCGTAKRVAFAQALRCDSLDSSLPLWSRANLAVFSRAVAQLPLLSEFPEDP